MVIRISADIGDLGPHRFDLRCIDIDGQDVIPKLEGGFDVAGAGGNTAIVLGMTLEFKQASKLIFVLRVDRVQLAEWPFEVAKGPEEPQEK